MPSVYDFLQRSLPYGYSSHLYTDENGNDKGFLGISRPGFTPESHYAYGDGWKFHLSIHPEDLPKAWDIVSSIAMENDVGGAKVTTPDTAWSFHDPSNYQAGKQITIYGAGSSSWADQMREIEIALRENGIRPSVQNIEGDRMVPGSRYAGYRNEKAFDNLQPYRNPSYANEDRYYVSAAEISDDLIPRGVIHPDMAYNPSSQQDSLQHIDFSKDPAVRAANLRNESLRNPRIAIASPPPPSNALSQPNSGLSTYQSPDGIKNSAGNLVRPQARYNDPRYDSPQQDNALVIEGAPNVSERQLKNSLRQMGDQLSGYNASGSTASIAHVSRDGVLTVANVGDSPVNIYLRDPKTGEVTHAMQVTADHSAKNPMEAARIQKEGGFVAQGRAGGSLALSRALGDKGIAGVSHEPETAQIDLNRYFKRGYEVVVTVESDGAFERGPTHASRQAIMRDTLNQPGGELHLAEALGNHADAMGSNDNISSLAIALKEPPKQNIMMSVFDGHGKQGGTVSSQAKKIFADNFEGRKLDVAPVHQSAAAPARPSPVAPSSTNANQEIVATQEWIPAFAGDEPIKRVSVEGWHPQDVEMLERALQSEGLTPIRIRSATLGDTIRIAGYNEVTKLNGVVESFGMTPAVRQAPRENALPVNRVAPSYNALENISSGDWQPALAGGAEITRMPVSHLNEAQIQAMEVELRARGFTPYRHDSATLGPTLRIAGEDVQSFNNWKDGMSIAPRQAVPVAARPVAQVPVASKFVPLDVFSDPSAWHGAYLGNDTPVIRTPISHMSENQVQAMETELRRHGFDPYRHDSQTMGPVLRLEGNDAVRFEQWHQDLVDWKQQQALIKRNTEVANLPRDYLDSGSGGRRLYRSVSPTEDMPMGPITGHPAASSLPPEPPPIVKAPEQKSVVTNAPDPALATASSPHLEGKSVVINSGDATIPPTVTPQPAQQTPPPVQASPPATGDGAYEGMTAQESAKYRETLKKQGITIKSDAPASPPASANAHIPPVIEGAAGAGVVAVVAESGHPPLQEHFTAAHDNVPLGVPHVKPSLGTHAAEGGMAVAGVYTGATGFVRSYQEGDKAGMAVNGANTVVSGTQVTTTTMKAMGKSIAPELEAIVGKVAVPLMIADGIYQVATEKGNLIDTGADGSHSLGNKGERAAAVAGTTGLAIGMGALGVSTAGVGVAVVGAGIVTEKAIEVRRAWKELDHEVVESAKAKEIKLSDQAIRINDDPKRPDVRKFGHIMSEAVKSSSEIKDDKIIGKLERKDGLIVPSPANAKILSDPRNLDEISRGISAREVNQKKIMDANESSVPSFMRLTEASQEKLGKYTLAKGEVLSAQGAQKEITMFREQLKNYDASPEAAAFAKAQQEKAMIAAREAQAQLQAETGKNVGKLQDSLGVDQKKKGVWDTQTKGAVGELIAKAQQSPEYKGAIEASDGKLIADGAYGRQTALALKAMEARGEIKPGVADAIAGLHKDGQLQYTRHAPIQTAATLTEQVPNHTAIVGEIQTGLKVDVNNNWDEKTNKAFETLVVKAQTTEEYKKYSLAHGGNADLNGTYDEATRQGLVALASRGEIDPKLVDTVDKLNKDNQLNKLYHGPMDLQNTVAEVKANQTNLQASTGNTAFLTGTAPAAQPMKLG